MTWMDGDALYILPLVSSVTVAPTPATVITARSAATVFFSMVQGFGSCSICIFTVCFCQKVNFWDDIFGCGFLHSHDRFIKSERQRVLNDFLLVILHQCDYGWFIRFRMMASRRAASRLFLDFCHFRCVLLLAPRHACARDSATLVLQRAGQWALAIHSTSASRVSLSRREGTALDLCLI